jgi:hypothetical protein
MRIFVTLLITIAASLTSQAHARETHTTDPLISFIAPDPSKRVSFNASMTNNKVILNWVIAENETTDKFEIEKSMDGENFSMVALVFATDKAETANYQFYEKATNKKMLYRIKIVDKNNTVSYSSVLTIDGSN